MSTTKKLIRFDSLFKYKDIGGTYYEFLKKDHSEESWEFLMELNSLSQTIGKKEIEKKVEHIIENFLKDGSPKEINISNETKEFTLKKLEDYKGMEAFKDIRTKIVIEMKYDSFKRFVRSKECLKIVEKYAQNSEVILPVLAERFNYTDSDFDDQILFDEDLKFMDILYQDSPYWELLNSFKEGACYGNSWWSHENYIPNVTKASGVSIAKYDIVLPFAFEHVLCSFFPLAEQIKFDPQCGKYETFNYKTENGKSFATIMYNVTFDYPFNCRLYPMVASGHYDPEIKKCVQIFKPCEIETLKEHKWLEKNMTNCLQRKGDKEHLGKAYKMFDFQSTHIQKVDNKKTLFTQIHLYALGGWINNKSFMKLIAAERGKKLLQDLVGNIKKTPENVKLDDLDKKDTFKGDGLARILFDLQIHKKDKEYHDKIKREKKEKLTLKFEKFEFKVDIFQNLSDVHVNFI